MKRVNRLIPALACGAAFFVAQQGSASSIVSTFDTDLEGWQAVGFDFDVTLALPPSVNITRVLNTPDAVHDAGGGAFDGNPGGFARFTDTITDPGSFLEAPSSLINGGDLSGMAGQTISYDHRLFNEGIDATSVGPYVIVLISGDPDDLNAYVHVQPGPSLGDADTGWVTVSTTLDAANFVPIVDLDLGALDPDLAGITPSSIPFTNFQTTKSFEEVLGDVSSLLVSFELVDNNTSQVSESAGVDNFRIVPEPTSLVLMGLGGLLIARRRR